MIELTKNEIDKYNADFHEAAGRVDRNTITYFGLIQLLEKRAFGSIISTTFIKYYESPVSNLYKNSFCYGFLRCLPSYNNKPA